MPVITNAMTSILERLEAAEALTYCKAFEPIPARLPTRRDETFNAMLRALRNRSPFVLVAADDVRSVQGKAGGISLDWRCELDIMVYCGGDHRSDMVAGRLDPDATALADAGADPGVRKLLEDVFRLLAGWAPIPSATRLNPTRGSWHLVDAALSIWEWTFSTELVLASQPMPPRARYTSARVDNQTATAPPAIIASEELP